MTYKQSFTLTIASGQTESAVHELRDENSNMILYAPETLPETVNIRVAGPAGNFRTLRSGGSVIVLAADCADPITMMSGTKMKLVATGAVAGARVFEFVLTPLPLSF